MSLSPFVSPATRLVANDWKATHRPVAESEGPKLEELPWTPAESTDTRTVCPVLRSCTKTSLTSFVSPATRLVANDWKATTRPVAESEGLELVSLPWVPAESTDTRTVCPVLRSCTKTSRYSFVSPATRLVANDWKATTRPVAEIEGLKLLSLPWLPAESTDTRTVCPVFRSCTKMSVAAFVSPATRLVAP